MDGLFAWDERLWRPGMPGKSELTADAAEQAVLRALSKSELQLLRHSFISGNGSGYRIHMKLHSLQSVNFFFFAILDYLVLFCARNFLSHKHNTIVNKHRQNALVTFNVLGEAAGKDENRDVILTYVAARIFSPQDTGHIKQGGVGFWCRYATLAIYRRFLSSAGPDQRIR